ncbi:MAG: hypothetical protein ABIT05_11645 [Chitinophagaceae bacterium]
MRLLSILLFSLTIIACNNTAKKKKDLPADETGIKDTVKQEKQMPETIPVTDTVFTGLGTEPFWSVYVIANSKILFHPADGPDVEVPYTVPSAVNSATSVYSSTAGPASIELIITKKDCSDGMSEVTHPYSVTLSVNKTKYAGCGRMGK